MLEKLLYFTVSYLFGSISVAVIVSKLFGLPDPRVEGSNNPGATNVLRLGGKLPAVLTMLGDGLKGFLPAFLGVYFGLYNSDVCLLVIGAVIGHIFPIFFRFQGGKGVATAFGSFIGLNPIFGLSVVGVWAVSIVVSGFSSMGALVGAFVSPFLAYYLLGEMVFVLTASLVGLLIFMRHRENIIRLFKGTEKRVR